MLDLNEDMEKIRVLLASEVGSEFHNLMLQGTLSCNSNKYEQKDKY